MGWDGGDAVGGEIRRRENGEHAGRGGGGGQLEGDDAGMGMGRADHRHIGLSCKIDIVAEAPLSSQQGCVFPAAHGLTDGVTHGWSSSLARVANRSHGRSSHRPNQIIGQDKYP